MNIRIVTATWKPVHSKEQAAEIAKVGMCPSKAGPKKRPIGTRVKIAGHPFTVTGYATKEEFLAAVEAAGLPVRLFAGVPDGMYFQRLSTD